MNIRLESMTVPLMRLFFRDFAYDPDTFEDVAVCKQYRYSQEAADAFYHKHNRPDRRHFAVLYGHEVIGDLYLMNINAMKQSCTMSIHMKNDSVKNKGFGTEAEKLALAYAFEELDLETVYADALIKNTRSRHVLIKVGFRETRRDELYSYYVCRRTEWLENHSL